MIDTIQGVLRRLNIGLWKILETDTESRELFFIRQTLDMNRAKKVTKYTVTVYRNFEDEGKTYTGSATVKFSPSMTEEEIEKKLKDAFFAASLVKNPLYPLAEPSGEKISLPPNRLDTDDPLAVLAGLKESLYKNDNHKGGGINTAELFINRHRYRLVNSSGVDVSFNSSQGDIELIVDWQEGNGGVELYNMFSFADYRPDLVEEECRNQIEQCRLRARAKTAPDLPSITIVITGDAVADMMGFYVTQADAQSKYEGISQAEPGKVFQGEEVKGDRITITLDPFLPNAPGSAPYDADGYGLSPVALYQNGVLKQYHGSLQYCHYMNVPPTGQIKNIDVPEGSGRFDAFLQEPYVEILSFSDFQMDNMTGDFGGEVRLARYFDGKDSHPLTGASLSVNLFEVQKEMYLSTEMTQKNHYRGPKSLLFPQGHLAGGGGI